MSVIFAHSAFVFEASAASGTAGRNGKMGVVNLKVV
jgi:hypothetical protein